MKCLQPPLPCATDGTETLIASMNVREGVPTLRERTSEMISLSIVANSWLNLTWTTSFVNSLSNLSCV